MVTKNNDLLTKDQEFECLTFIANLSRNTFQTDTILI